MTIRIHAAVLLAVVLLSAQPAAADDPAWQQFTHPTAGVTMQFPPNWLLDEQHESLLVWSPDDAVKMLFQIVSGDGLTPAVAAMNKELATRFADARMSQPAATVLNGMDAVAANGTGSIDGRTIDIGVMLVRTARDQVLLIMGFSVVGNAEIHGDAVRRIMASINPS